MNAQDKMYSSWWPATVRRSQILQGVLSVLRSGSKGFRAGRCLPNLRADAMPEGFRRWWRFLRVREGTGDTLKRCSQQTCCILLQLAEAPEWQEGQPHFCDPMFDDRSVTGLRAVLKMSARGINCKGVAQGLF